MPLQQRKHFRRPGLPELVALLLLILVAIPLHGWWNATFAVDWRRTAGTVLRCDFKETHYNAQDELLKVSIQYDYVVGGITYTDSWTGPWPNADSPNALPQDQIHRLQDPNFPLVVLYNPSNPSKSRLDYENTSPPAIYAFFALLAAFATGYYYVRVYPAWRGH